MGVLLLSIVFLSCKEKNSSSDDQTPAATAATVKLNFKVTWENAPYSNSTIYHDSYGNRLRIDNFVSYISQLSLIKTDGSEELLKDYSLLNWANNNKPEFSVPKGNYSGIKFLIGVPEDVNTNVDPAQYPNSHVLSVAGSQGMFWNWNTGYIFTKLEGKADTTGTDLPLLDGFSYHTGDDHFTRYVILNKNLNFEAGNNYSETIHLQIDKIFMPNEGEGINLAEESAFHSPGPLMSRFVDNFKNAFSVE